MKKTLAPAQKYMRCDTKVSEMLWWTSGPWQDSEPMFSCQCSTSGSGSRLDSQRKAPQRCDIHTWLVVPSASTVPLSWGDRRIPARTDMEEHPKISTTVSSYCFFSGVPLPSGYTATQMHAHKHAGVPSLRLNDTKKRDVNGGDLSRQSSAKCYVL